MRVVLVDDDTLVAISLKTILESDPSIEVVATADSGETAINLYKEYKPDVMLMDIRMSNITGLDAGRIIIDEYPEAKILFLTTFLDDEYIVRALSIGAKGYILKQDFDGIIPALYAVFGGQSVFGNDIVSKIPTLMSSKQDPGFTQFDLSQKEIEIITEVASGYSNKEIATRLFLSEGTVRNYISNILVKLDLRDRTQLAIFYYKNQ